MQWDAQKILRLKILATVQQKFADSDLKTLE